MKAYNKLPEGYREIYSIDLQKNTKLAVVVNLLAALIAVALIVPVHFFIPITTLFDVSGDTVAYFLRLGILLVLMIAYMVIHELVHGVAMKMCGTKKVKYGFTGMYAFAGSDDYYDKRSYIFIALAPIVLLGAVIGVINFFVPAEWFWVVYFVQVINLSGAAGDLYVSVRFSRFPRDILVKDYGVGMVVYSKTK